MGRTEGSISLPAAAGAWLGVGDRQVGGGDDPAKVRALDGAITETNEMTRRGWWTHSHAGPTASRTADCTHWCLPGLPDVWASMLFELLL